MGSWGISGNIQDVESLTKALKITDENFVNFLKDVEYSEKTLANYEVYMKKNAIILVSDSLNL